MDSKTTTENTLEELLSMLHDLKRSVPKKEWTAQMIMEMKRLGDMINRKLESLAVIKGELEYFHAVCA